MTRGASVPTLPIGTIARRALLATAVLATLTAQPVAQENCQQAVDQARRAYAEGNFDQVLRLTQPCVGDRASAENVFALRARTYVATDQTDLAEKAVVALLGVNPDFSPGSEDLRRFASLVARIKRELSRGATSSVSKMNESLMEAPATVAVVTADQIKRRGYLDLEAVFHDLPGFDISRSNGTSYANLYLRGYRSDFTNRLLFLVDGVEQNDLHTNVAEISRQYPLSNVDRIEVVYGPASTMYGANAFLGVVNVITREPEDLLTEGRNIGVDAHAGGGVWNTKYVDATVAGRFRSATLSLTGRLYRSDEWDRSGYDDWNYDPAFYNSEAARRQYDTGVFSSDLGQFWSEIFGSFRFVDPFNPISLDQAAMKLHVNGRPVGYSDLADDWMISARLRLKNFSIGGQASRRREGAIGASTDRAAPGARNGNVVIPHMTSLFVRYTEPVTGSLTFSYFGQARVQGLAPGSSLFSLNSYLDGPLTIFDLASGDEDGLPGFWAQTQLAESSTQIRNELNLVFRPTASLGLVGGVDFRNGSIQGDYVRGTDCDPEPRLFSEVSDQRLYEAVSRDAEEFDVVNRIARLLTREQRNGVLVSCVPTGSPASLPPTGGDHFAVRDIGVFAQASYRPISSVKLVAGGRVDNEHVGQGSGFGTVFNPRLAAVVTPHGFVLKGIYAEAFKDPAYSEKFGRLPGVLDLPDGPLEPERVRNFEVSAGRQWQRFAADVAAYRATYDNLINLRPHELAKDPDVAAILSAIAARLPAKPPNLGFAGFFDYLEARYLAIGEALPVVLRDVPPVVIRKTFAEPTFTNRFDNIGSLRVWGVQANASFRRGGLDVFGNYTFTHPMNKPTTEFEGTSSAADVRVADIASHRLNLGAANRWGKIDGSFRVNAVGARRTGPGTTVPTNRIPGGEIKRSLVAHGTIGYALGPHLTAQLVANNIFNTRYEDPGVGTADGVRFAASLPQPRRSLFVRVLTHF